MCGRVLLIIPPCFLDRSVDFEIGFPVHLALLGRIVEQNDQAIEYLDMTLEEKEGIDSFKVLTQRLSDPDIVLVGISNHTLRTSVTTQAVAERVKSLRPDVSVLVGGVNATFMWRELLDWCPSIDFILRGYAQQGFRALLGAMKAGATPTGSGLVQRSNGKFREEPLVGLSPKDLETPRLDALDIERYVAWTTTYPLLTHTGCGFSCNFCTSVMPGPYQNKEVFRPIEDILDEMNQAIDLGFDKFFMSANIFTSKRDWCLDFCQAMEKVGVGERSSWVCMTRVEFVDAELLTVMRAAGCANVAFGVETASASEWKSLQKGHFTAKKVTDAFEVARAAGVGTTAYLMLGAPTQTHADIEATVELVRELDPDYRVVSFFQPFPGTPYWDDYEKFGLADILPFDQWNFHEAPICRTAQLSKRDLVRAAVRFYLDRGVARRIDLDSESLQPALGQEEYFDEAPVAVRQAVHRLSNGAQVMAILEDIAEIRGSRDRLVVLYWLSAALRDGALVWVAGELIDTLNAAPIAAVTAD